MILLAPTVMGNKVLQCTYPLNNSRLMVYKYISHLINILKGHVHNYNVTEVNDKKMNKLVTYFLCQKRVQFKVIPLNGIVHRH